MNKRKSAISVILFSIYALVFCHASIPHFHFDTENANVKEEIEKSIDHSHGHSHHHGHSHETSSSETWLDYFAGLLGDLGHKEQGENHLEEMLVELNAYDTKLVKYVTPSIDLIQIMAETTRVSLKKKAEIYIRPPILYEQLCSSSTSLRGPPSA